MTRRIRRPAGPRSRNSPHIRTARKQQGDEFYYPSNSMARTLVTWVSRDPAVAQSSGAGAVTAVILYSLRPPARPSLRSIAAHSRGQRRSRNRPGNGAAAILASGRALRESIPKRFMQ